MFKQTREIPVSRKIVSGFSSAIVIYDFIYSPIICSVQPASRVETETTDFYSNQNGGQHRCVVPVASFNREYTRRNHAPVALHQTHQITPLSQALLAFAFPAARHINVNYIQPLLRFSAQSWLIYRSAEQQLSRWPGLSQSAFDPN